ncbi:MAG: hypothetical protein CVU42_00250 [Chloroflexi bacterium HGW-Chloroflexi-4]|jgi:short-subunit dehydrogenase|nr:MAG: hypothetical protein CVU42_00250 [Chloroflexi bacterium HGW-Chloroflexi-4]
MNDIFIITGVNKGLGLSLAIEANNRGLITEGVSKSKKSIDLPNNVIFTQLDCSKWKDVSSFWGNINQKYKEKNIVLINNAGTYIKKEFLAMETENIESVIKDNFLSSVFMTRGLLDNFQIAKIINIISITALEPGANKSIYGASKSAMSTFFKTLRLELKEKPINIIDLYPHTINTWSLNKEPNAIDRNDLSKWIINLAIENHSFEQSEITLLPNT